MISVFCGLSAFFIIFGGVFLVLAMLVDFSGKGDVKVEETLLMIALGLFTIGLCMMLCVGFGLLVILFK